VLLVWVLAPRPASGLMKFLMSAACSIEGGEGEGSGRLVAGSASSFRIDEGSDVGRMLYQRR
jgi:hypothetical protein